MSKLFGGNAKADAAMDTLIGRQTEILGDVRFSGGLHVDGRIRGKVLSEGSGKPASVSVSENGMIEGDVRVNTMVLNGRVVGDIHAADRIHLAAKARVTGNVYYKILQMDAGAEINGQLVREGSAPMAALTHERKKDELDELSEVRKLKGSGL